MPRPFWGASQVNQFLAPTPVFDDRAISLHQFFTHSGYTDRSLSKLARL
jgi:hypothetical protein